jgi:hypothetical protein
MRRSCVLRLPLQVAFPVSACLVQISTLTYVITAINYAHKMFITLNPGANVINNSHCAIVSCSVHIMNTCMDCEGFQVSFFVMAVNYTHKMFYCIHSRGQFYKQFKLYHSKLHCPYCKNFYGL